jgi:hypothetical protein
VDKSKSKLRRELLLFREGHRLKQRQAVFRFLQVIERQRRIML